MKRTILLAIAFAVALTALGSRTGTQAQRPRTYVRDRILFKLKTGVERTVDPEQIGSEILRSSGARTRRIGELLDTPAYVLQLNERVSVQEAIDRAMSDPRVEYAEPDYLFFPAETTPNDPRFGELWGLLNTQRQGVDIAATRAWDFTTGSPSVVAAVMDGGIDITHQDLAPNIWQNPGEVPGNDIDDDANGFKDDINGWNFFADNNSVVPDETLGSFFMHGTHVAGTIGAAGNNGEGITGVAWQTKLVSIRVFGRHDTESGSVVGSTVSDSVEGINYVIKLKRSGINVAVINASWGGTQDSRPLHDAIAGAAEAGITFVCAAGNLSTNVDGGFSSFFPAAWRDIQGLISVAAVDREDNLIRESNYGRNSISVGAPGAAVLSTTPFGGYAHLSGTSMSSPHVAGIVALLAAQEPGLGPAAIRRRIEATAEPILALATRSVSAGRANAFNALTNTLARVDTPGIVAASATKKFLILDGMGFKPGSIVIEVNNGAVDRKQLFADSFALANGSYTHIEVKFGKELMNTLIPRGTTVNLTVFNSQSGQRSAPFPFARF